MSQWGAGQPGFQYPMQTGYNPGAATGSQFQPNFGGGLGMAPQPAGFPPQPTGFQPQQTGYQQQQQQRPPPPPVPPMPSGYRGGLVGQPTGAPPSFLSQPPLSMQQRNFMNASPAGILPQQTGFLGGGGLVPQMTGAIDPRIQMMSSTFMPANPSVPFAPGGTMQFAGGPQGFGGGNLVQSIQQYNQDVRGTASPKIPWTLSRAEKKNYDSIFRAWDANGTGYIDGQMAFEVFGQSGLEKNDLAKVWALADADNKGKLNQAEFHVAMGLIFRKINGMDIPDQLPPELVPPSSRDLDTSVNFLIDILKNDKSRPSSTSSDANALSRGKVRSFNDTSAAGAGGRKDATVYKHADDAESPDRYYQSRSRHLDRRTVRAGNESPAEDLSTMRAQLANTAARLERATEAEAQRTAEDDALDREMEDLRYRVRRVQEDLDYVSSRSRSTARDEERRKLERDLLHLMHERMPEVERKIEERERRREKEKREMNRERDKRNDRFGKYDGRDRGGDRDREYERDRDDDDYSRGTYDRDRDRDRDYDRDRDSGRDRSRNRDRDREYGRNRSNGRDHSRDRGSRDRYDRDSDRSRDRPRSPPETARSPPPPPPAAPAAAKPPPAAPKPASSLAPNLKSMTPKEREAYIREQAQRRLQDRMRALGVVTPSSSSTSPTSPGGDALDTSVEDRLVREKHEAEEKARQAEKDAEERERSRKERLDGERALKGGRATTPAPAPPAPAAPSPAVVPPAPKRAPAPPPPRKGAAVRSPASATTPSFASPAIKTPVPPAPRPPAVTLRAPAPVIEPEEDPEEVALREREERLKKQKEARAARLRQLELEEQEEARRAEEEFQQRKNARQAPTAPPPAPAPAAFQSPPPPPPPALPAPAFSSAASTPATEKPSTNPFSKFMNPGGAPTGTPTAVATPNGGMNNPFFRPDQAQGAAAQAPPAPPAPTPPALSQPRVQSPPVSKSPVPAGKTSYNTVPSEEDDEWDQINEKDDEDSSDDEFTSSRDKRNNLAQQLFGNIIPARPQSAASSGPSSSVPQTPAPPPAPPAPMAPPAPAAPMAPPAPAAPVAPPPPTGGVGQAAAPDRGALFGSIMAGAKLKKAVTNDRSKVLGSGQVLGDTAPPPHISAAPREPSPERPAPPAILYNMDEENSYDTNHDAKVNNRQSVDWYAGMAADHAPVSPLPTTLEMNEEEEVQPVFQMNVQDTSPAEPDPLEDVDKSIEYRVRSLYSYDGQRAEDLSFAENLVIIAHPAKSGGAWWYGSLVKGGKTGFFPSTYVQELETVKAKALYSYPGGNTDELPFVEGDVLTIVDRSEPDWWKTEQDGVIFIVPAGYLELTEGNDDANEGGSADDKAGDGLGSRLEASEAVVRQESASLARTSMSAPIDEESTQSDDSDEDSSEEEYHSFESDSDDETSPEHLTEAEKRQEHEARELERRRVLEAAGLILKKEQGGPPPRPPRRRSAKKRRTPPQTPGRKHSVLSLSPEKSLPATPEPEAISTRDSILHVDDAFDRYEAYLMNKDNRVSVSSFDSAPLSPGLPPSMSPVPSKEIEAKSHLNFLNFLGRKTPVTDAEKPRLQISAPMPISSSNSVGSPTRDNSPAFGSSWASLVNKEALDGIPGQERKRQEAIFELINTEAAYVRDLQLIVEVFFKSILPMLNAKETTVIFANIEDILLVNTTFLSSLEERQKDCRLYIDIIGDLLSKHMSSMGVYVAYCVNHGTAIKILQSLRDSRADLATQLQKLREDPVVRNLDLSNYLLTPMQRITRYPLLIRQILVHTQNERDKANIIIALEAVEGVLNHINESIREQEGRERLAVISKDLWIGQGHLDLTQPTKYMGSRRLIKEGTLMKYKSRRKLRAFLCNDIMVLTDDVAKTLYRMPYQLSSFEVQDVKGNRDDLAFRLTSPYPRGGESIQLKASSARECDLWMKAISSAIRRAREAEKRAAVKARGTR